MLEVFVLFYMSVPSWPHINALCSTADCERFPLSPKIWPLKG